VIPCADKPPPPPASEEAVDAPEAAGLQCTAISKDKFNMFAKQSNCLKCADAQNCETCCPFMKLTHYQAKGYNMTYCAAGGKKPNTNPWDEQVNCYGACAGSVASKNGAGSCPGETMFPEGAPGFSGFGKVTFPWSIVDKVKVPETLPAGPYLLSWRCVFHG
jgi:hypothetical protein